MRLWSLHPEYLDAKGLVALWREGLLAKAVLEGKTRGYVHHPQLTRFRFQPDPIQAINVYLRAVFEEGERRKYRFNPSKIDFSVQPISIFVTTGQLEYEWKHLLEKLKIRDPRRYCELLEIAVIKPHPMMEVIPGDVEPWEIVKKSEQL
ncbi:MAG: pyrimidine dimer DNA glycosylase/endonuclease V [Thermodesulforhabdaceae bacterium]